MKSHRRGHGEGTIGRRADGRWMARVDLGWKDGKRVRKAIYGHTQEDVRQKLTKELRNRDLGILPRSGASPTLRRFLTDWLATVKNTVRVRSWEKYTGVVNRHLVPDLGPIRLEKLTPQRVQALLDAKLAAGLHPTTVSAIRLVLRQALHQAVRWEMIPRNVVDVVSPPKVHRHEWTPIKTEQARALLAASQGEPFGALYLLALSTGARRGELLALRWGDIDLETGALAVRRSLQRTATSGLVFEEPKTRQGRRTIHLSPATIAALKAHRRRQAETRLRVGAH
jgi:integrase